MFTDDYDGISACTAVDGCKQAVGGFGLLGDEKAGDACGEGVVGAWWVLPPTGKPIRKKPTP
jgi:hypothetical protein